MSTKHTGPAFPDVPLLPCPFCGSAAQWFRTGRDVGVECSQIEDCHGRAQTDVYEPENALAAAGRWNTRNDQAADLYEHVLESREELLEALRHCAAVCAGEVMHKRGLIEALESARAAISKATGGTE